MSELKVDKVSPRSGTALEIGDSGDIITLPAGSVTEKGADIASATTLVIGTDGDYFDITGTTAITGMTVTAGRRFTLQFNGAVVLTYHATNLYLPEAVNLTTEANDSLTFIATAANQVRCIGYELKDGGRPVAPAGGAWTEGCFADLSVDKTVANSTGTQVQLDRESFDIGNNFNTSTYLYTIPSDGYYFVHWQLGWGVPGVGRYESWITKNDVQAFIPDGWTGTGNRGTGEAGQINMWTTIAQFAEDDYLKLWAWHNSGSTQTLHMNASAGVYGGTWLNVWKVSGL